MTKLYLAPMAGFTDSSYRRICREHGCDVTVTEMVSAKALYYRNENTALLLKHSEAERPLIVQLFGSDPELMAGEAAKLEEQGGIDGIDLNFGCPAPKIVRNHEGSFLLTCPELMEDIVSAITAKVSLPVSVKIRMGFYQNENTAVRSALACERGGAKAIALHARTTQQMYSGAADWNAIREVKEAVGIEVIGNGDIVSAEEAVRMLEETGCDHLMIGRASRGDPWIFERIRAALDGRKVPDPPGAEERIRMAIAHAQSISADKGEYTGILQMRSHVIHYLKGLPQASVLRGKLQKAKTLSEMEEMLMAYLEEIPEHQGNLPMDF